MTGNVLVDRLIVWLLLAGIIAWGINWVLKPERRDDTDWMDDWE